MVKTNVERYFQCPYCSKHKGGHSIKVPPSIGKYRIKIVYDNIFILKCSKCGRVFKYEIIPKIYLWEHMNKKERTEFKQKQYTKCKEVK